MVAKQRTRLVYLDYLRVIATFAVIILHVSAQYWDKLPIDSGQWQIMNAYNSGVRWGVPIFIMISGVLFLSRDISIEKLYKKNIFRIVVAFLFWTLIYALFNVVTSGYDPTYFFRDLVLGEYHMWFLFTIVGLYMIVPFVKKITESQTLTKYFLLLCFIFTFLLPNIVSLLSIVNPQYSSLLSDFVNKFKFNFTLGYVGYFVLGYYLNKQSNRHNILLLIMIALVGYSITFICTGWGSMKMGSPCRLFYNNISVNVLLMSIAMFLLFKKLFRHVSATGKFTKGIILISDYSFGVYLVHILVLRLFEMAGLTALTFHPAYGVALVSVIVFVVAFVISAILHQIPVLKKYIA